ncbi:hypothetical protein [Marasmitruncus massiliensis]|uniref:hypothetical protein n=1 Tax=Marasmitruncus massiliensis TaxID=1944642 RepID=UPI000C7A5AC8|nr:hypothetical protein [Marasmitruncus massiliensis]
MNKGFGMNVGSSLILMIFVLLCLVTFSTLSLVSANADYKLTAKTAESVSGYYEADAKAEMLLAAIDEKLISMAKNTTASGQSNSEMLSEALSGLDRVTIAQQDGEVIIGFQVKMDDRRALQVSLRPTFPLQDAGKRYVVTSWQVIQTAEWESDDTLTVWDGEDSLPLFNGES